MLIFQGVYNDIAGCHWGNLCLDVFVCFQSHLHTSAGHMESTSNPTWSEKLKLPCPTPRNKSRLLGRLTFQQMVNWWFGARWFGIPRVPLSNNPFHKGISGIQTTNPNQQWTISWMCFLKKLQSPNTSSLSYLLHFTSIRGHYITNPNNAQKRGKFPKITIHFLCLIPLKWVPSNDPCQLMVNCRFGLWWLGIWSWYPQLIVPFIRGSWDSKPTI